MAVPFDVSGKTALVTGAGSGINYCFAKLLLSKNCNVVIADLSLRPEAQKLVDTYTNAPKCLFIKTDVAQWSDLTAALALATTTFPTLDIVCPGAGVFEPHWSNFWHPPGTPISTDSPTANHYATLDINITHPIRLSQLALSHWLNSPTDRVNPSTNPKRILHISSIAGQTAAFPVPLYVASKHAISGFVRSLAPLEETLGVRVNCVAPGIIRTPLWTDHPEKLVMVKEGVDEWVEPEEVAEAMLRCVVDPEVGGGWVMEVLKDATRNVVVGAPAPEGKGGRVSGGEVLAKEVFGWLGEEGWGVVRQ